jgi:peroxiredoxin Q/BCP
MAKTPEVGMPAPDFTLPGVLVADGEAVRADYALSAQRGRPAVLAFYPGDNTSVCTKQLCSYTSGLDSFTGLGATVWGISPQDVDSHEGFARKYDLAFPLLADVELAVTRQYGIGLAGAGLRRSVFVIDGEGILRWKHVTLVGLTFPKAETIAAQLAALASR